MEFSIEVLVFLGLGIGFIYGGFRIRSNYNKILLNGVKTRASVVEIIQEKHKGEDGRYTTYYYPVINFTDTSGLEVTQKLTSNVRPKHTSKTLDIVYLKEAGAYKIVINSVFWQVHFPRIFMAVGVLLFVIGLVISLN